MYTFRLTRHWVTREPKQWRVSRNEYIEDDVTGRQRMSYWNKLLFACPPKTFDTRTFDNYQTNVFKYFSNIYQIFIKRIYQTFWWRPVGRTGFPGIIVEAASHTVSAHKTHYNFYGKKNPRTFLVTVRIFYNDFFHTVIFGRNISPFMFWNVP